MPSARVRTTVAIAEDVLAAVDSAVQEGLASSRNEFLDTALKNLQISMNIVRVNDSEIERDTWVLFKELYPEIWNGEA